MQIEKNSYASDPESLLKEEADCLWVLFADRKAPSPLSSASLQCVDWKLQGELSRFLQDRRTVTTFLPGRDGFSFSYLALEPAETVDWKAFVRNCEGMKMKRIVVFCEDSAQMPAVEKELRRLDGDFPKNVVLGSDAPPEKGR